MSVELTQLGPIARAYYDGFCVSNVRWNGDHMPLVIGAIFDAAVQYAKQHGEEPKAG